MNSFTERRKRKRFRHISIVELSPGKPGQFLFGVMQNMSGGGVCFESDDSMDPGDVIDIAIDRLPYRAVRRNYRAAVKWCDVNGDANAICAYKVGAKFL